MVKEINKPSKTTYWVAKDSDGNIVHIGIVEPDQVVTSPHEILESYENEIDQIKSIENKIGKQPAFNHKYNEKNRSWEFKSKSIIYLPVDSIIANDLNNALYKCIDPSGSGNYAEEIPHNSWPGYVLFKLDESDIIPIALGVDPTPLVDALSIAVQNGGITQQEADDIVLNVQQNAGKRINLMDFIPNSWKPYVLNETEAIRYRYISDPEGV